MLTKLNTNKVVGLFTAARTVYNLAGPLGYFQGLRARVLYQMPSTAISWYNITFVITDMDES